MVYTHPTNDGCPACVGAKEYLKNKKVPFKAIRGREDGWPNVSHKTWPKIYSPDGKFVGGFSDLQRVV
jgi:glutaredoxin